MKNSVFSRIIAVALIAMSIMAVAIPALADYGSLNLTPGETDKHLFNISESTSYYVYLPDSVPEGSTVRVKLDYNDTDPDNPWKQASPWVTLVKGGRDYAVLNPTMFGFNPSRTTKSRIYCTANSSNASAIVVVFHDI